MKNELNDFGIFARPFYSLYVYVSSSFSFSRFLANFLSIHSDLLPFCIAYSSLLAHKHNLHGEPNYFHSIEAILSVRFFRKLLVRYTVAVKSFVSVCVCLIACESLQHSVFVFEVQQQKVTFSMDFDQDYLLQFTTVSLFFTRCDIFMCPYLFI